ncbi:3-deoxy-D-manno-octulosonic acid transferase [Paucibacter sp. Y2R2-4]|uniref:3-deoxy-D-manno-octulosonic acid transferase n=1 Tax=Paucibacter sp. Y2R2-4 TaxID=2893553 RepID=UPI0021E44E67|nr:3-deoxy-D-manno-octulosonic acid transferase [Paucibacter sp. Y2R2-4]MCV2348223.1 3-deoxy-D-manno-octulosonic acid transferase [Paucibacter sp. Y2R2-4]
MSPVAETFAERLSRWAYAGLLRLLTPFYLLRLWRRGSVEPQYRQRLGERLGFYQQAAAAQGWLWVHAVSLGETRAAAALISALRERQPTLRLLLTHSTATGWEAGQALLQKDDAQTWLPYDTPGAVRRFLQHWQPALGVLMETEIWPTLQFEAAQAQLPMVLANARLSERSQRRGERFKALLQPAGRRLTLALAQTQADAERLSASGAASVQVQGNLKFDMQMDEALLAQGRKWREQLQRPVLLAAVTREGEEAMLLQAWQQAWEKPSGPGAAESGSLKPLLLIVPRHPQRFDEVAGLIEAAGLRLSRRSQWDDQGPSAKDCSADACLGDSMREMALYYAFSDVALLGGSFAPLGGQNLIEAAACGCPVIMGPHTFNFAEASALAIESAAAQRAPDMTTGLAMALSLCQNKAEQALMRERSLAFAAQHRGAAARMAEQILALGAFKAHVG